LDDITSHPLQNMGQMMQAGRQDKPSSDGSRSNKYRIQFSKKSDPANSASPGPDMPGKDPKHTSQHPPPAQGGIECARCFPAFSKFSLEVVNVGGHHQMTVQAAEVIVAGLGTASHGKYESLAWREGGID
jgi:hypothetical protein